MKTAPYVPIAKTSDAELRAMRHMRVGKPDTLLPIFELTRSRKTSKVPSGSVERRFAQLEEAYPEGEFILDLSTHEDLINDEIVSMFDSDNGYDRWCNFLETTVPTRAIPCILVDEEGSAEDLRDQATRIQRRFGRVAFRGEITQEDTIAFLREIDRAVSIENVLLFGDAGFINRTTFLDLMNHGDTFIREVLQIGAPKLLGVSSSSFPSAVAQGEYGLDDHGDFPALEIAFYDQLVDRNPQANLKYSDYASIHPIRYPTRGGSWVPRVDVPLQDTFFYHRYRRDDGGYEVAAQQVVDDDMYEFLDCWGHEQIEQAANGSPNGKSPSFWISVRMNIHMTRRLLELQ